MAKRSVKPWGSMGIAVMLVIIVAMIGINAFAAPAAEKDLAAGSTWFVHETTRLTRLTITEGAAVRAPEGYRVTLTVDGVETPIRPGTYRGNVVLTPTEDILVENSSGGGTYKYHFRTALYVNNGEYVPEKSVAAAVKGGTVTSASARGIKITSVGDHFNGIIATGDMKSSYSVNNPEISFTGNGGNDFAGYGAAIMASGKAVLIVDNARVVTKGAVRTAVFVGGSSTMQINNSYIETNNGSLPEEYLFTWTTGGVMMEVPFMLGLTGNVRATNLVEKGTAYYNNTHIRSQGWGALSTDASEDVKLYVTKCTVETVESGYGAYALGGSDEVFSGCTFNVADMAMIGAGGDAVFTDGSIVNSRRFGVMYHGSGDLTIDKGTVFNTQSTAIQIKSPGHKIVVDNAQLNAGNGILLQTLPNDDPYIPYMAKLMAAGEVPSGESGKKDGGNETSALFRNMILTGDIVHGDTASGPVAVTLENATLTGGITTAAVTHARGPKGEEITMQTPELYTLIGEVTNSFCATDNKYGLTVSLDSASRWVVGKTSYLTGLTLEKGASVTGPKGYAVTLMIDGVKKPITPGEYKGKIELLVQPS